MANEAIAEHRKNLELEKQSHMTRIGELQGIMTQLKADLYAKFGNNINLEPEEE